MVRKQLDKREAEVLRDIHAQQARTLFGLQQPFHLGGKSRVDHVVEAHRMLMFGDGQ